jgi:hypothetical protein
MSGTLISKVLGLAMVVSFTAARGPEVSQDLAEVRGSALLQ